MGDAEVAAKARLFVRSRDAWLAAPSETRLQRDALDAYSRALLDLVRVVGEEAGGVAPRAPAEAAS